MPVIDVDTLPPTQYLILEVLAARHRLGESSWSFPAKFRHHLNELERAGLIGWKSSVTQGSASAWLTPAGRASALADDYVPPDRRQPWEIRATATGGGPCPTCRRPYWTHACVGCSPDYQTPGPGCINCRSTGMDQTPCRPPKESPDAH